MGLYGIYGSHTTEACPLFNESNRRWLLQAAPVLEKTANERGLKIVAAYHSGLEHTFLWIVESDNAHAIQDLMVETEVAKWNSLKIVPLRTLQNVVEYCQTLEAGAQVPQAAG